MIVVAFNSSFGFGETNVVESSKTSTIYVLDSVIRN